MLWRRRNKKLDKRLNEVVDSAEEARRSYRPKPRRVVIDTSFVDQRHATDGQEEHIDQGADHEHDLPEASERTATPEQEGAEETAGNSDISTPAPAVYTGDVPSKNDQTPACIETDIQEDELTGDAPAHGEQHLGGQTQDALCVLTETDELQELRDTVVSLTQELEDQRTVNLNAAAQSKASSQDVSSTPELLAKIKDAVGRAQAAEDRELKGRAREAEVRKEALLLRGRVNELERHTDQAVAEKVELEAEISSLSQQVVEKSYQISELESASERAAELERELLEKRELADNANAKLSGIASQTHTLEEQSSRLESDLKDLNKQHNAALKKARQLQNKLNDAEAKAAQAEKAQAREAADAVRRAEQAEKALKRLETSAQCIDEKFANEQQAKSGLEDQLAIANDTIAELQVQLTAAELALADTQNKSQSEIEKRDEEHHNAIKHLEGKEENITAELAAVHAELQALQGARDVESTSHEEKLKTLREDLQTAKSDYARLAQQLADERSKNESISNELIAALEETTALQTKLSDEQRLAAKVSRESRLEADARSTADAMIRDLKCQLAKLEKQVETEKSSRLDLERELEDERKDVSDLKKRLSLVKGQADEVLSLQSDADQREANLLSRVREFEKEMAASRSEAESAASIRADLESEIKQLKRQLETAKKAVGSGAGEASAKSDEAALRFAADKPVFMKAVKTTNTASNSADQTPQASLHDQTKADKAGERKSSKGSTSLAGTIQKDTELTVLNCRVLDRSVDSARINIIPDKFNASIGMPVVGDSLTLKIKTAWDTTEISCQVMWLDGTECGLNFKSIPVTLMDKPSKSSKKAGNTNKPDKAKRTGSRRTSAWS